MTSVIRSAAFTLLAVALVTLNLAAGEIKADTILRIEKALPEAPQVKPEKPHKVLVYTNANGFVHGSIPTGAKAFELLGKKTGAFEVTKITDDPAIFDTDLAEFDAIVLMSTTGSFLRPRRHDMPKKEEMAKKTDEEKKKIDDAQKKYEADMKAYKEAEPARRKTLLNFVSSGKGLVGVHAATDAYHNDAKDWPEYADLIGGSFRGHPWGKINIKIDEPSNPINAPFEGKNFEFSDEIYQFKELPSHSREKLRVLLSVDLEKCGFAKEKDKEGNEVYKGESRKDHDYAVAWIRKYGTGRVFYTLIGHRDETYQNPLAMKYFLNGMQYALGDLKADDSPSKPAAPKAAENK